MMSWIRLAGSTTYTWQMGSNLYIPGEVGSIARQFMRCILHQLTPNKVFIQLFQTQMPDPMRISFFKTMAQALTDFNELSPTAPLQFLLETLNQQVFTDYIRITSTSGSIAAE